MADGISFHVSLSLNCTDLYITCMKNAEKKENNLASDV